MGDESRRKARLDDQRSGFFSHEMGRVGVRNFPRRRPGAAGNRVHKHEPVSRSDGGGHLETAELEIQFVPI